MKVSSVKTKTISAASETLLDAAVAAWVEDAGEAELVAMHFAVDGGTFTVLIVYTT